MWPVRSAAKQARSHGRLAVVAGVAAEAALVDQALLGAVEGQAEVLQLDDGVDRLPAHDLGRGLVDEVVTALDRVEGVPLPRVLLHVGQGRAHPPLGRAGVGAGGVELGEHRGAALARRLDGRPQPGPARPDDHRVEAVPSDLHADDPPTYRVGPRSDRPPLALVNVYHVIRAPTVGGPDEQRCGSVRLSLPGDDDTDATARPKRPPMSPAARERLERIHRRSTPGSRVLAEGGGGPPPTERASVSSAVDRTRRVPGLAGVVGRPTGGLDADVPTVAASMSRAVRLGARPHRRWAAGGGDSCPQIRRHAVVRRRERRVAVAFIVWPGEPKTIGFVEILSY